jgi:hypothetical protein
MKFNRDGAHLQRSIERRARDGSSANPSQYLPRPWREERLRLLLSQPFRGSSDEPSPLVNVEFHQAFVSHFQQERLAGFLIHDIGAFHDLVDFERLLAERAQDIFSIIQHDCSLQNEPFRSSQA